jgi:AAHS family 3-hydroxyphenylpropionic acid transporter
MSGSTQSSTREERDRSRLTIGLCLLVALLEGFDLQAAGVAAPKLAPAMGLSPGVLSWFFSASTLGMFIGAFAGGWLSDRKGRKFVLVVSVALFGLCSILTGAATTPDLLIAARFLTGIGLGGALPNLIALVAENSPPERKSRAVALMYCGTPLGGAVATVASLYTDAWQAIFHLGGIMPLVVVPLLVLLLPKSRAQAAVAGGAPRTAAHPMFGEGRAARTILLWGAFFATLLVLYLLLNWTPSLLKARGFGRTEIGIFQIVFNVAGGLSCVLIAPILDRRGGALFTTVVYLIMGVFLALLATASSNLWTLVPIAIGLGFGVLVAQAILYSMAPKLYRVTERGAGVGAAVSIGRLGSAAGPLLAGEMLAFGLSPSGLLLAIVPIVVVGGVAALFLALRQARAPIVAL